MNPSRIVIFTLAAGLLLAGATGAAGAAPSFDCAAAKTFREQAVCRDQRLARLDRKIAEAFAAALARSDTAGAAALRNDQRDFLVAIDEGFDNLLSFGHSPQATASELRRALAGRDGALAGLEEALTQRLGFLKSLDLGRKTPIGNWQNASTRVSLRRQDELRVHFEAGTFGWTRYNCEFEARLARRDDDELAADTARNLDTDTDYANHLTLRRRGARLLLNEVAAHGDSFNGWTCPHRPKLGEVLFPVRASE